MKKDYAAIINSPLGKMGIVIESDVLGEIEFLSINQAEIRPTEELAKEVVKQLQQYFQDPLFQFDLPLHKKGTVFQQKVWQQLLALKANQILTYGEFAGQINSGARAVGNACRRNPIPIVVPCHRVVAKNHQGGYAGNITGKFAEIKKWLLQHEGVQLCH